MQNTTKISISDHNTRQIVNMAKKFFSDEKNMKRFEKWHLETYGYSPCERSKSDSKT